MFKSLIATMLVGLDLLPAPCEGAVACRGEREVTILADRRAPV